MNKKFLSVLSLTGVLLLASCQTASSVPSSSQGASSASPASSEPSSSASKEVPSSELDPESKISLFKGDSVFSFVSARGAGSSPLATYHHADLGDVPYVELEQYVKTLGENTILKGAKYEKLADHLYGISQDGATFMTFNPVTDELIIKNLDFANLIGNTRNHDLGNDPASPSDSVETAVHTSGNTTRIGEIHDEVFDMAKYGFDMVEEEGKLYFPYHPVSSTLTRNNAFDFLYNGSDFYLNSAFNAPLSAFYPGALTSYYASEGEFVFANALYAQVDPVGEEKYRFYAESEGKAFSLKADGSVELLEVKSTLDAGNATSSGYALSYEEGSDGIYLKFVNNINPDFTSEAKIPNYKTYFNAKSRSKSVAKHALDILRFQFENLYGLRDQLYAKTGANSFDSLLAKLNLRDRLLSVDSSTYDEALCEFLMGTVDDGHTTYNGRSLFSGLPKEGVKELVEAKTGPRRTNLFAKMNAYTAMRAKTLEEGQNPQGLFFSGETAVIRFDGFVETDGKVVNSKGGWSPSTTDIGEAFINSSTEGLYLSIQEIKKHPEVKNVVFDMTVNGGGLVVTIPYLSAVWTDDPHVMAKDLGTGVIKDYHYDVDLNRNGIFGEPEDTLKGQYEFFVLTSDFSFSCANEFPSVAYTDGVKVIGKPSGGGACPVATMCDGSGTFYNSSMPRYFVYQDKEGNYVCNDTGVPILPGYELEPESWYDLAKLNNFCNSLRDN